MAKSYVVIIVDVNSIPRQDYDAKENSTSKTAYDFESVRAIKEVVRGLLLKHASNMKTGGFNLNDVLWSFKLYNSSFELFSKTSRSFQPFNKESFGSFESSLDLCTQESSLSATQSDVSSNKIEYLSTSLKSVLSDLPWPEACNLDGMESEEIYNRNEMYLLFRVPKEDEEIPKFVPHWTPAGGSKRIMSDLLPKAFFKKVKDCQIHINFMDMSTISEKSNFSEWSNTETSKPMLKIVNYLSGRILPFVNFSKLLPVASEFPSYVALMTFITENYSDRSEPTQKVADTPVSMDDANKTIRRMQGSISSSTKISPQESVDRESIFSESRNVLTSSLKSTRQRPIIRSQERWFSNLNDNKDGFRKPIHINGAYKKRKHDFEELEPEEGYSSHEIQNWCLKGNVSMKNKSIQEEKLRNNRRFSSPQVLQPYKRVRRERNSLEPGGSLNSEMKKKRYSEPMESTSRAMQSPFFPGRGNKMLTKVFKKVDKGKDVQESVASHRQSFETKKENELNYLVGKMHTVLHLPSCEMSDKQYIDVLTRQTGIFMEMCCLPHENCSLDVAAQVLVTQIGKKLYELKVPNLMEAMTSLLIRKVDDLNYNILAVRSGKSHHSEEHECKDCVLQILIRFEFFYAIVENQKVQYESNLVEDVVNIMNILRAYMPSFSLSNFVNDTLIPRYHTTHKNALREIAVSLNIEVTVDFGSTFDSPGSSTHFQDDCSLSSVSSSLCGPEDSTSQHPLDNMYSQQSLNNSQYSQRTSLRTASFHSQKKNKQIVVPRSVPAGKLRQLSSKAFSQSTRSGSARQKMRSPKPKKVRRNLFDIQPSGNKKDVELLMRMATSSSPSFSRSPSLFKSPISKLSHSPRSPARTSPFFLKARARAHNKDSRTRRKLVLDEQQLQGVPDRLAPLESWGTLTSTPATPASNESLDNDVYCPETPGSTRKAGSSSPNSYHSKKRVVEESPETEKPGTAQLSLSRGVHSLSFYSSGGESSKNKTWEKSRNRLLADKIRGSVRRTPSFFNSQSTLASDHYANDKSADYQAISEAEKVHVRENSAISPIVASNSDEINPSIQKLLTGEIRHVEADSPTQPLAMETPSKKQVSFNFSPNCSTPSSSSRPTNATPKSILKDTSANNTPGK